MQKKTENPICMHLENGNFLQNWNSGNPARRETPKTREIPIWEIPGRKKFEAIQEGLNGNFALNIPALETC